MKNQILETSQHPRTLVVGVYAPYNRNISQEHYFEEFLNLIKTLGVDYEETFFMKIRAVDPNLFLTKGKIEELFRFCQEKQIEEIIFSELLSPLQERNLEDELSCTITDREKLILEIFRNSAHTSEGRIQIEMAETEFMRTRLLGKGTEFAQQAGFIGGKGPGETIKEQIKRVYAEKIRQAKKKLDTLQQARTVQRKQRLKGKVSLACIIGYTNAGKSSLLNRLTKSEVLAEDKLFATLDTTTREFFISDHKKILLSDTVGFINQLPHNLIEAFKSTLNELYYASLLIHIIDLSNPAWEHQIEVVRETLKEIEVDKPMVYVFNKIDKLTDEQRLSLQEALHRYQPHLVIHTRSKEGVASLIDYLKNYDFPVIHD